MTTAAPPAGIRYGPEGLPERTLGWAVLGWASEYLLQPDGPDAGAPWKFTPEQARFILWWYAIDERGRFTHRYAMYRRMKGAGKDPLAAALSCVEFVGPCRFGGWRRDGTPHAIPHSAAWVQIAAVSKDQTRNTMTLFPGMLSQKAIEEYGIDLGKEIIYAHRGRCRIEAVTSSPRALEGGRATFVVKNETHHWIQSNEGIEMSAVIARNAAKSRDGSSRVLAISNAHAPDEASDAEHDWKAFQESPGGFLYDSIEAPHDAAEALAVLKSQAVEDAEEILLRERLLAGLEYARGDAYWLDAERLMAEILDPRTSATMARRYYLNQIAASSDKAFDAIRWDQLAADVLVAPGSMITLGFDGSETRDHTVLVGTEVATGHQFIVGYWEPRVSDDGEMRIPVDEVDQVMSEAFDRWNVLLLYADPFYWKEYTALWAGRWNRPGQQRVVEFNTTLYKKMAYALLDYSNAINAGDLTHDGDPRFRACIANAQKRPQYFVDDNGEPMWTIQKDRPDSPFKIDAAMAGCLSWAARAAAIAGGAMKAPDWHGIWLGSDEDDL